MEITGRNSSVSSGHCSADMGDRHLCRTAHKSRRSFNGADTFRRLSYRFRDPERYDIIVFPYQHAENTYYIKRIIGLPGETVQVIDGYMYINGKKLDEHYGAEVMEDPGIAAEPIKLGDDEYFVLGDNRNHSSDSRVASVGVLTRDMLIGRAWVRIYPFNKIGVIKHE